MLKVATHDKRTRKSAPKSGAGCTTCKVRHVKCDEQKPACIRCRKSGRQCDSYSVDGRRPSQDPLQVVHWHPDSLTLHQISIDVAGSSDERRAFHFFRENSVADFPGFFESSFWGQLVLQASHAEPSIRHAVIALGSLHETALQEEKTVSKSRRACDPFALRQCNKAIGHLHRHIGSNGQGSKEMLLMACAIFICFENLQGNYESALSHMQGGLRIFHDWQAEVSRPGPPGTASSSQHHQSVDGEIVQMFSRLNIQALVFVDTHLFLTDFFKQDACLTIDSVPKAFVTLKQARGWLDNILSYKLQASIAALHEPQGSKDDLGIGWSHNPSDEHLLPRWLAAFNAFVEGAGLGSKDSQGASLLEIQYNCAEILLSVGIPPQETAFDDFGNSFARIVALATSFLENPSSGAAPGRACRFSFETGLVPPLYLVATRCRDPRIRRQALSLLSSTSRQEGVWNSDMCSRIAERLILIEEERDSIGQVTESDDVLVTSRLTVLNATIHSEEGKVLLELRQQKCGPDEEVCFLDEWMMY